MKENTLLALHFSGLAYQDNIPKAIRASSRWTSATGFYIRGSRYDVLTFRGSQQPWDWVMNASAVPWKYAGKWHHGGFSLAHWSIWSKLYPYLRPDVPLILTGHSLGGAMAEISAHCLRGFREVHLITFGKPNTQLRGQETCLRYLSSQISVVHGSDLVTVIPKVMYEPDEGQNMLYLANDGTNQWNPSGDFRRGDRIGLVDGVKDHSIRGYQRRVMGWARVGVVQGF